MTILSLSTDKVNMHARHETALIRILAQLTAESSKQKDVSNGKHMKASLLRCKTTECPNRL